MRPGPGRCGFRNEYSGSYTVTDQNRLAGIGCGMLRQWEVLPVEVRACTVARRDLKSAIGYSHWRFARYTNFYNCLAPPPHERYAGEGSGRYCMA